MSQQKNFVAPYAVQTMNVQQVADTALQPISSAEIDGSALQAMRTVSETSTPIQRGFGIAIKGAFVCIVATIATYALTKAGASGAQAALFFVGLLLVGVALLFHLDYTHSPIGGERHKATLYADVQMHRIDSDERVQLAKVDAFLQLAEMAYGNGNGKRTDDTIETR